MPWKEFSVTDHKSAFARAILDDQLSMAAACRAFGISRPTGYKILGRYQQMGEPGLAELSRAPRNHYPAPVSDASRQAIIALRAKHPTWGPRKLKVWLASHEPDTGWPAASTIGDLLKGAGLVPPRRLRKGRCGAEPGSSLSSATDANHVWCVDYKGQFACGDGRLCYPLTVSDLASRYLLRCQALPGTGFELAQPTFVGAFREFGLPQVIRTDNGPPFATNGLIGMSRLSLWWLKLGIRHERIAPGRPQQNGVHERMHRTLKADAIVGPGVAATLNAQQQQFDTHRTIFNQERPHEALHMETPASRYAVSPRAYPLRRSKPFEYPGGMDTRFVHTQGCIRWRGALVYLSDVLCGEYVGIEPVDDAVSAIYVGPLLVALLDPIHATMIQGKNARQAMRNLARSSHTSNHNV
jgi:putative transposase